MKCVFVLAVAFSLASTSFAQEGGFSELLSSLMSDPKALLSFVVQFALGAGLGYYSIKVIKYILALIGIMVIGTLLNIWQLGGLEEFVSKTGLEWSKIYPLLQSIAAALGILTVLPIGLGFFLGVVIAARK